MDSFNIFLSSTFRGMEEERDAFSRIVMPSLQRACEQRGIRCNMIDLRWGVDDEKIPVHRIVEHCLVQIDHTVPVFVGLVGKRYGSRLPFNGQETISATHHEFRHAIATDHERLFLIRSDPDTLAAQQADVGIAEMLGELAEAERAEYFDVKDFIEIARTRLLAMLERSFPLALPSDPLRRSAYRQDTAQRLQLDRLVSLGTGGLEARFDTILDNIVSASECALQAGQCMALLSFMTLGDAELYGAALAHRLKKTGKAVFVHQHRLFGEMSGAWAMRRLLARLIVECGRSGSDPMAQSEAQMQVKLAELLAELHAQGRVLRVILVRPDPVDVLEYCRPLLSSPALHLYVLTSPTEIGRFPLRQGELVLGEMPPDLRKQVIRFNVAQSGKDAALGSEHENKLATSPVSRSISGTILLASALIAWGDLKPEDTSQNEWFTRKVEEISKLETPAAVFAELLDAVSSAIVGVVPEFKALSVLLLDVLRVADGPLELDELVALVDGLAQHRELALDLGQLELVISWLDGVGGAVLGADLSYRFQDSDLWPIPADAGGIRAMIVRQLIQRQPDSRRAYLAGRAAIDSGEKAVCRQLALSAGYPSQMSISMLTAVAAEEEGLVEELQHALEAEPAISADHPRCRDALAMIAALSAHDYENCYLLAQALTYNKGKALFLPGSALAMAAHDALESAIRIRSAADFQEGSSLTGGDSARKFLGLVEREQLKDLSRLGLVGERLEGPQYAADFLANYDPTRAARLPSPESQQLISLRRYLVTLFAVEPMMSLQCVDAAYNLAEFLRAEEGCERVVMDLCQLACRLAIFIEETRFANRQAAAVQLIEDLGINGADTAIIDFDSGSFVGHTVDRVLDILNAALDRADLNDGLKELIAILAQSDRRWEKKIVMAFAHRHSLDPRVIDQVWQAQHKATAERWQVGDLLLECCALLREVLADV